MNDKSEPAAVSEREPAVTAEQPSAGSTSDEIAVQASQGKLQKAYVLFARIGPIRASAHRPSSIA